jgi:hypothetical protein
MYPRELVLPHAVSLFLNKYPVGGDLYKIFGFLFKRHGNIKIYGAFNCTECFLYGYIICIMFLKEAYMLEAHYYSDYLYCHRKFTSTVRLDALYQNVYYVG